MPYGEKESAVSGHVNPTNRKSEHGARVPQLPTGLWDESTQTETQPGLGCGFEHLELLQVFWAPPPVRQLSCDWLALGSLQITDEQRSIILYFIVIVC